MSMARMNQDAERLEKKVRELLAAAEQADAQEDAQYGKGQRGDKLPEDLRRAQSRLARIRRAGGAIGRSRGPSAAEKGVRHRRRASRGSCRRDGAHRRGAIARAFRPRSDRSGRRSTAAKRAGTAAFESSARGQNRYAQRQRAAQFHRREEPHHEYKGGFVQGYNGHITVCGEHQIIVAQGLSNQAPDVEYFIPMVDRLLSLYGHIPEATLADAGFFSEANIRRTEEGLDVYIAPARTPHGEKEPACDAPPAVANPAKPAMQSKLKTGAGRRYTVAARRSWSRSSANSRCCTCADCTKPEENGR